MNPILAELRMRLSQTLSEELENGDVSSDQMIEKMRKKHRNMLRAAQPELEAIALKRLLNDITARQSKIPNNTGQIELFDVADMKPMLFSLRTNKGVVVRRTGGVKLRVLIDGFKSVRKTTADRAKQSFVEALEKMASRVGTQDITLDEAEEILRRSG